MGNYSKALENLRKNIERTHNMQELMVLVFDLGIKFEQLAVGGLAVKVASLIEHVCRHGQIEALKEKLINDPTRQHVQWEDITWGEICSTLEFSNSNTTQQQNSQERQKPSTKSLDGRGSFLLVENGPQYCTTLRAKIFEYKQDLKIKTDFFDTPLKKLEEYKQGMEKFLDDPLVKWLITVFPDEPKCNYNERERLNLAQDLDRFDKYIVSFDSGHELKEIAPSRVAIIETDHVKGIQQLLRHLVDKLLPLNMDIHFVILYGESGHLIFDSRREFIVNFLKSFFLRDETKMMDLWRVQTSPFVKFLHDNEVLRVTALPAKDWDKANARDIVINNSESLDIENRRVHTCFLCDNDDVALGVIEGIEEWSGKPLSTFNDFSISVLGFDGAPDLIQGINDHGIPASTMELRYDMMANALRDIILGKKSISRPISKIPAQLVEFQIGNL